jgi:hypothetical protein
MGVLLQVFSKKSIAITRPRRRARPRTGVARTLYADLDYSNERESKPLSNQFERKEQQQEGRAMRAT